MHDQTKPGDAWRAPHRLADDLGADSEPHWSDAVRGKKRPHIPQVDGADQGRRHRVFRDTEPDPVRCADDAAEQAIEEGQAAARMLGRVLVALVVVFLVCVPVACMVAEMSRPAVKVTT